MKFVWLSNELDVKITVNTDEIAIHRIINYWNVSRIDSDFRIIMIMIVGHIPDGLAVAGLRNPDGCLRPKRLKLINLI